MKIEELMGSLRGFEMNLQQRKKMKTISFKTVQEKSEIVDSNDEDNDQLALLTKKFHKFLKKVGKPVKSGSSSSK